MSSVVERVRKYTDRNFETPHLKHYAAHDPVRPGDRALCGAILKGVDHGYIPVSPDHCVVCVEIAARQS